METKGFFQFDTIINVLALSDSFEYQCYGSTVIRNAITPTVQDTTKVDPRTVRVKALKYFRINHGDQRVFSI